MPALITNYVYDELGDEDYLFLELAPLVARDILGLDELARLARPINPVYPRRVLISTVVDEDCMMITDGSYGLWDDHVGWADVFFGDYLLVELTASRMFTSEQCWDIVYKLRTAIRIATTP
ncbi:hypothetical protein LXA43DRAFT_1102857 [Ganoderma leucocontextum]|nr:hypothetical protein LXA43DRAFT_1102857 [Ganoderma leucocontextum]